MNLPQPPEGILDPQQPWHLPMPKSPGLWGTLKARLTGRRNEYGDYSSYVNITEADADRLIANMKKDPRGYPQLDQTSGTPAQWMERQRLYQEWLVEAYLEDPFRKQVDQKIEDAEIDRLVNTRRQNKVKPQTPLVPKQEEVKPVELPPVPPEPKVELIPEIPKPVAPEKPPEVEKPKSTPLRDEDLTVPYQMPSNVSKAMAKYGAALDKISNQLNHQNSILTRGLGHLRRINEDLDDVKFSLEQMSETYQETLDDFETEERIKESRKKFFRKLTSPFSKKQEPKQPKQEPKKLSQGGFLNSGYPVAFSGGGSYPGTPIPGLAAGGIATNNQYSNTIQPGIYDNPVRGNLAPGTAVIPFNRNYGKQILNQYDQQKYEKAYGEVIPKSINALLGAAVTVYGSVLRSLGPFAGYFNSSIPGLIDNVASILGISRTNVIDMFGGPAYAGTEKNIKDLNYFYKSWRVYMNNNNLYFPGASGVFGGRPLEKGEIAKDILMIGEKGEGLSMMGGTNVGKPPAWIPFGKDAAGKLEYSSGFGWRWGRQHSGIDLAGDPGIKIITPFAGKIVDLNRNWPLDRGGGYGNYVEISHERPKIFTFYGHMQDVANGLNVGTEVKAGEVIGTLGNTGRSTGPHLHWEVRTSQGGGQIDPVEWTHQNKPSFQGGGWLMKLLKPFLKPKGLGFSGVRAGFTAMGKEGFEAIMGGANYRNPNKPSLFGKGSRPVLGHGAYNAPTVRGAMNYYKPGGGVVKTIVPRGAVGNLLVDIIEPQSRVNPATFDKGKLLADKLLRGQYANSSLAKLLRSQLISGQSVQTMTQFSGVGRGAALMSLGSGLAKLGGRFLGVLNLPVIGDAILPEGTSSYDQISGPNAYYNAPGYKGPRPSTTIEIPTTSSPSTSSSAGSTKPKFVELNIPTNTVMSTTHMRRM